MTTATRGDVEMAAAWRLLALGFSPPAEKTLAEIEALAEALFDMGTSPELDALLGAVRATSPGVLATQYAALFRGTVRVAPYEGSYELDPIRQGRQMADVAGFYRAFGAEAHGPGAERPDYVELLSRVAVPALVVVGAADEFTPVRDAESMHAQLLDSTLVVIEGAGHMPNLERPDEFNTALRSFLAVIAG